MAKETGKPEGQKPAAAPQQHAAPTAPKGGKAPATAPGGCLSWSCKKEATRFSFCPEHYEHFKFGLIKKTGEPVSDYEKKFEHYVAYTKKRGVQKVA